MGKQQLKQELKQLKQQIASGSKPARQERADGWSNILTGIGVAQKDKRLGSSFAVEVLDSQTLEDLWRADDLAARIVETVPEQALREGFEIRLQESKEEQPAYGEEPLESEEDLLKIAPSEEIAPEEKKAKSGELKEPVEIQKKTLPEPKEREPREDAFPIGAGGPPMPEKPKAPPKPIARKDESIKEQQEAIADKLRDLGFEDKLFDATCQSRAYGGAALFLGVDDGQSPDKPIDETRIKAFDWITVLNAFELQPDRYYTDPRAPQFGEPETYKIRSITVPIGAGQVPEYVDVSIHESRILRFEGIKVSRKQLLQGPACGWGDSVLVRPHQVLQDFNLSWNAATIILQDYGQAVFKIEGLAELLATDQDGAVINRAKMIDLMRSTARALMLDTNEDFERKGTPLTGYAELLDKLCLRLSAAAKIPVTFLMGQSPAGLNATGDSDIRIFYDQVRTYQRKVLNRAIERTVKLISLAKTGPTKGKEITNFSVFFPSLWQPTEKEQAETRKLQAETDQIYINCAVLTAEEVASSRFGGDEWTPDTSIDFEAREQAVADFEVANEEYEVEKQEAIKNAPKDAPQLPFPPKTAPKSTEGLQK